MEPNEMLLSQIEEALYMAKDSFTELMDDTGNPAARLAIIKDDYLPVLTGLVELLTHFVGED